VGLPTNLDVRAEDLITENITGDNMEGKAQPGCKERDYRAPEKSRLDEALVC
jgi:hypothetical protein